MSDAADIAVVIVNYNGGEFIGDCLDSLASQQRSPGRIVVIDNGSSDGSGAIVASNFPEVQLIRLDENIGFAAANNRGFDLVGEFEWVALLNPDTVVAPDWVTRLEASTNEHQDVAMFSCRLRDMNNYSRLDGTGDIYHVSGLGWRRDHGAPAATSRASHDTVFGPCAAAAMYKLASVREAEGFDERYFCYNEDTDLAFRIRLRGGTCLHLDDCVVDHAGSGITGRDSDFTVYHGHRNLVWTYFKNMPTALLWLHLPGHLLMNLVVLISYSVRGRPGVVFRAKRDALLGLSSILRERKKYRELLGTENRANILKLRQAMATGVLTPYIGRRK